MNEGHSPAHFLPCPTGLRGSISVPGDKSVSHRALLLGAVNDGPLTVKGFLRSADTLATLAAVRALGVAVEEGADYVRVHGRGWEGLQEPANVIDVANSGTLIRLLPGLVAPLPIFCVLTGDDSIRRRPMARIIKPLAAMGVSIVGRANNTLPPVALTGGRVRGLRHELAVASAQVKSCLLIAGLRADGPTTVVEPAPSRDHTERMIRFGGGRVDQVSRPDGGREITVWPLERLTMSELTVPGDFSSAAFFVVAAVLTPASEVTIHGVGLNPTRTGLLDVLSRMGADIEVEPTDMLGPEPVGRITARSSSLVACDVNGPEIPTLIDELPLFLLAAARARGVSHLRGAAELRAKESDRLRAMATILESLGVSVTEHPDGMDVRGQSKPWTGAHVITHADHRVAMVAAVAGLISGEGVTVDDAACVAVSFPEFMGTLARLGASWHEADK